MEAKAKTKGQARQVTGEKPAAEATAIVDEFRMVELGDLVRESSLRFPVGIVPDADIAQFIEEYSAGLSWPEATDCRNIKDPEPPRYASPEAEEQAIRQTTAEARICLNNLRALVADGDRNALSEFVQLLAKNVAWLEGYSWREKKGNLTKLAGLLGAWPVMFNSRPRKQRQVAEYLARIELAPEFDPALGWHQLWDMAEANEAAPPRFDNPEDKCREILDLSFSAGRRLDELQLHVADGDMRATVNFVKLLETNVTWLESYSDSDKGNLKAIASLAPVWPMMIARCSRRTKAAVEYLKKIEQGTKAQISLSPKWGTSWANEGAVATLYARGIRIAVHGARNFFQSYDKKLETNGPLSRAAWGKIPQWIKDAGKLAPLTKESAPQWFEIGWQRLVEKHNGHPENDKQLCKFCDDNRANKFARAYSKKALPSNTALRKRTISPANSQKADIRDRIKQRIFGAFISLAPPL